MGRFVIVAYRPRPGKEAQLLELTKDHLPILRGQGLATDRPSYVMKATDGTIIEVFEWKSAEAIAAAHRNPVWQEMCARYSEACEYVRLESLGESKNMFAEFESVTLSRREGVPLLQWENVVNGLSIFVATGHVPYQTAGAVFLRTF